MINFKVRYIDRSEQLFRRLDAAERRVLMRIGGFVRTTARRSIRKPSKKQKKQTSDPGHPPFSHTNYLKNRIFFAYDASRHSVVVGAVDDRLRRVPSALEHGGRSTSAKGISQEVEARPFMQPAGEIGFQQMDVWKDSIK